MMDDRSSGFEKIGEEVGETFDESRSLEYYEELLKETNSKLEEFRKKAKKKHRKKMKRKDKGELASRKRTQVKREKYANRQSVYNRGDRSRDELSQPDRRGGYGQSGYGLSRQPENNQFSSSTSRGGSQFTTGIPGGVSDQFSGGGSQFSSGTSRGGSQFTTGIPEGDVYLGVSPGSGYPIYRKPDGQEYVVFPPLDQIERRREQK
jgi:hypothetical protein